MDKVRAENAVRELLLALGQDITSEGLKDTPRRVAEMFIDQCQDKPAELDKCFTESFDELIMVRNIPLRGFCEHHLLPYVGKAHIAYIPRDKVLGLSKLVRLVNNCSRGFTIQERVTREIADKLYNEIKALGVAVVLEAVHTCMLARGVKASGASATTSAVRGAFRDAPAARQEFLTLLRREYPIG